MSEDEQVRISAQDEEQDEVEAHGRLVEANDEGGDTEGGDDFEAHRHSFKDRPGRD